MATKTRPCHPNLSPATGTRGLARFPAIQTLGLIVAIFASMAAGPPQVVRVRAPASEVSHWFPRGTELISLKPDAFEALIKRSEAIDIAPNDEPRLLKASHRARWEDGHLDGTSTFTVSRDPRRTVHVPLVPWNLAADSAGGDAPLRASDDGRTYLRVPPEGLPEVTLAWRQAARPASDGLHFVLDLPRIPIASLELDLPERLVPEGFDPAVTRGAAGRRQWRRSTGSGSIEVRLRDRGATGGSAVERPWISGPSTIDVGPMSASWRAEWNVELNGPSRSIRVAFSHGLEPTDASGSDVESTEIGRVDGRAEMTIHLRPDSRGSAAILLRGLAVVRVDKPWPLPTARAIDAEWLGGDVTVRLDRSRVLGDCRVLRGRRLAVSPEMAAEKPTLLFEPDSPGPAAELTFLGEGPIRGVEVHGAVRYGPTSSTLDARLRWSFPRGRPGELAFDLPDAWSIERITSVDTALDWHREPVGRGLARVRLGAPPVDVEAVATTIQVRASAPASGDGTRDLPRVRPVGLRGDEVWVADAPADRLMIPREADGLAWLDPAQVRAAAGPDPDPKAVAPGRSLAWRWCAEDASAVVAIVPTPREVVSRVEGTAEVAAGRLRVDWRVSIRPGPRPLASIPIGWSDAVGAGVAWRLRGGPSADRALTSRTLNAGERSAHGLANSPLVVDRALPEPTSATVVLEGTSDHPWSGRGPISLPVLPGEFHAEGSLAVRVEPGLIARVDARGLADSEDAAEVPGPAAIGPAPARSRPDLSRRRRPPRPRDLGQPRGGCPGRRLVPAGHGARRRREDPRTGLALRFPVAAPREPTLTMPPGTELLRVRRGRRALEILRDGPRLRIPIPVDPGPSTEILIEYSEPGAAGSRLRPTVPALTTPCLDFLWTVVTPAGREVAEVGPGLVPVDPSSSVDLPGSLVALPRGNERVTVLPAEVTDAIRDHFAATKTPPARSLGDQLLDLTSRGRPVVVDWIGLEEAGLGPNSPPVAIGNDGVQPGRMEVGPLCLMVPRRARSRSRRDPRRSPTPRATPPRPPRSTPPRSPPRSRASPTTPDGWPSRDGPRPPGRPPRPPRPRPAATSPATAGPAPRRGSGSCRPPAAISPSRSPRRSSSCWASGSAPRRPGGASPASCC